MSTEQYKQSGRISRRKFLRAIGIGIVVSGTSRFSLAVPLTPNIPGINGLLSRKTGLVAYSLSFPPSRKRVLNSRRPC